MYSYPLNGKALNSMLKSVPAAVCVQRSVPMKFLPLQTEVRTVHIADSDSCMECGA